MSHAQYPSDADDHEQVPGAQNTHRLAGAAIEGLPHLAHDLAGFAVAPAGDTASPSPSRGTSEHRADDEQRASARAAPSATGRDPGRAARPPLAVPSTATATKFTELLIRKNATERLAIRSAGMLGLVQDPSAERQPTCAARGKIDPAPSSDRPISWRVRAMCSAEDRPEHQDVGHARERLERHGQRHTIPAVLRPACRGPPPARARAGARGPPPSAPRRPGASVSRAGGAG